MKKIDKGNIAEKLNQFNAHWTPYIIAELNGQAMKIAKVHGSFIWHQHDDADELFWVIKGCLKIELLDQVLTLHEGDFTVIPKGTQHRPSAEIETQILMFEPINTLNTGSEQNEFTVANPSKI
jgi:mannose-6-phosphate isomerase-like protein (cupin superfamily)